MRKSLLYFILVVFLSFPISLTAQEKNNKPKDTKGFVALSGLTLPCKTCKVLDTDNCEFTFKKKKVSVSCVELQEYILSELSSGLYDSKHPSVQEIRAFLFSPEIRDTSSLFALDLLLTTPEGRTEVITSFQEYSKKYSKDLARLLRKGKGDEVLREGIWVASLAQDTDETIFLGLSAVVTSKNLDFSNVLLELTGVNWKNDLARLEKYKKILQEQEIQKQWAQKISVITSHIQKCGDIDLRQAQFPKECELITLQKLEPQMSYYLQRLQFQTILGKIIAQKLSHFEAIKKITITNYKHYYTPDTLVIIKRSVTNLTKEQLAELTSNSKSMEMLSFFSEQDVELARLLSTRLLEVANNLMQRAERASAQKILNLSKKFFSGSLPERDSLEKNLTEQSLISKTKISLRKIAGYGIVVLVALFLSWLALNRKREPEEKEFFLTPGEQVELQALAGFFGVSPTAGEVEFKDAYDNLAEKILKSPKVISDEAVSVTEEGNVIKKEEPIGTENYEYLVLKANFERVQELIAKRGW